MSEDVVMMIEKRIREIVREEMATQRMHAFIKERADRDTERMAEAFYGKPKPKSDLERAAEKLKSLAREAESQMKDCMSGSNQWFHASGYFQAMYDAEAYVQAMAPASPDWRKIAERLRTAIAMIDAPWDGQAFDAASAYDAAVKEADK